MKRLKLSFIALTTAMAITTPALAQQANQNINVLPVVPQQDEFDDEWFKLGDGFLQRQVEPTIAVSTRNPDHLLAFFNDYRAVDIPDDGGLGEETQTVALVLKTIDFMMAGLIPLPELPFVQRPPMASSEAWVGGSRSYDGGLTWSGLFMPGAPFDLSPASIASPIFGLEAATDPVAVAGPCGYVYVVFMGFTRGDQSKMVVARFQDLNNQEGGDTWEYQGTNVLEIGNNATNGFFLDKPNINLDVWRGPGATDQCSHRVYVSYSTFNGNDKNGNFRSKINFAKSEDLGETWDLTKIQQPFNQNQGSALAVDPRPGTPKTTGGGTVYLVWRHFFDPDTMLMAKTEDYGKKWSKPEELIGTVPMAPFDQPTISTQFQNPDALSFRSNGFPTTTVTGDGTVFVAWQERVDITEGSLDFGRPSSDEITDSPRIVMVRSTDGGDTWTDIEGSPDTRIAVDFGDRDVDPSTLPPAGFGALPDDRPSGPQVMPWLSFGGGRMALVYYESRGLLGGGDIGIQDQDISPTTGFISGIDRVVDFRAALLNPATGELLGTTQVSRYPISASADLSDGEQVSDIAPVDASECSPDFGPGHPPCNRQLNLMNIPQSGSGGSPFMGDYSGATPSVQFVYDEIELEWRWAIDAADVPNRAFHAIFADNRHLIPPTIPSTSQEWERYQFYGPPEIGGACINPGSRNTDVLTARVNAELIVSAPTTYKQLNARRGFPIRVQNGTGTDRFYQLTITQGAGDASFSTDTDLDSGDIQVFPYSSVSQVVYVRAGGLGPIRVDVVEINGIGGVPNGGQTGSVIFNPDPNNPVVEGLGTTETQDPFVLNPFVLNPFVLNPFVLNEGAANLSISNPFVLNPFVLNPFVLNTALDDDPNTGIYDVIDTTWDVGAGLGTNTASSYIPIINIDNAEQFVGNYAFQLIVYKTSTFAGYDEACQAYNLSQDQILSNVVQDPNDPENPFVLNPFVLNPFVLNESPENPFVLNPFVLNPFVLNSTFTMAPPDAPEAKRASAKALGVANDGTLRAPRAPETIKMTLRAYRLKPLCEDLPAGSTAECIDLVYDPNIDAPSAAVGSLPCVMEQLGSDLLPDNEARAAAGSECFKFFAPDLIPVGVNTSPIVADAGGLVTFPEGGWTLRNQGTADATAENRALRHGIYLSADDTVDFDEDGNPTNGDVLLHTESSGGPGTTIPKDSDAIPAFSASIFTIPDTVTEGSYNLILYVDDLEEVSELDEVNNKVRAVVPITVEAPNEAPVATAESFSATEDAVFSGFLSATDLENDTLTFSIVTQPANGSVMLDDPNSGAFTYTPASGYNGDDSFTFSVNDGEFDSGIATATITVSSVNDAPSFTMGADQTVLEDAGAQSALWATSIDDGDPADQVLTFNVSNNNSTLFSVEPAVATDGTLSYTPAADANGSATVTVTLTDDGGTTNGGVDASSASTFTISVTPVNDAPSFSTGADQTVGEDSGAQTLASWADGISAGPADESGQTLVFAVINDNNGLFSTQPAIASEGTLSYTLAADANGTATVTITLSDDGGTDNGGVNTSAAQTIVIAVSAINDPPVVEPVQLTINEDGSATGTLTVTDADGDTNFTYAVTSQPTSGSASFSDPTSGEFTYSPDADFNGEDQFTVTVTDNSGAGGGATVTITITAQNDVPVATILSATTAEDTPVATTLSAIDVDGDELTFTVLDGPASGSLSGTPPNLTYTPNADVTGKDGFTFQASDGFLTSDPATFTITVTAVNDPPVAVPDELTVEQNSGPSPIDLLANDFDVDLDPISLASVGLAAHGTVEILGGLVNYTPNVNYIGADSFGYVISDGTGLTASATVSVTVIDPVPDFGFLGLLAPWRPNNYRVNLGGAIPIKWYYTTAPSTEDTVDSAGAQPLIRIRGPFGCGPNDDDADAVEIVEDTGSSNLRYNTDTFLWQFNWDTDGLALGCYNIRITSQLTSQIDGPFKVQLK